MDKRDFPQWRDALLILVVVLLLPGYIAPPVTAQDTPAADLTRTEVIKILATTITGQQTKFRGVNLYGLDLKKLDFNMAILEAADLRQTDFEDAVLRNANLQSANLTYANLNGTNLTDADLRGADLTYASLNGADLTGADLTGAILDYTDLTGANLTGALLVETSLAGADLADATLSRTRLDNAQMAGVTLPDGTTYTATSNLNQFGVLGLPPAPLEEIEPTATPEEEAE